ncbi:MAG: Chromosome partition protein Smc [Candidatus Falkowbacteria bacterium GW2011_GWA2_39_24]|uniref:Chromosome partition protein Smc n=1 Tax=Candidatus Falkowbacteria bacterium GW2011_GWA2_39_24 TaxID=1618634 RepID=A0A0G0NNS9_9BACT|nr:MAG: Chromosome partition protein Smc [Candidatus Falkowbacteria bacterium GW2011_GWA2_39_24]
MQLATDRDDLSGQLNSLGLEINSYQMRLEFLQDRQKQISSQQDQVKQKIAQVDKNVDHGSLNKDKQAVEQELNKLEEQLSKVRQQINEFNSAQENKTSQLFAKQKEVQGLQMDINQLTIKLNDLQVNAARYETRLEDLEKEIRDNYNFLKEIKEHKVKEHSDQAETHQKILKLRSQLEMIGGIDPAIAKEYEETKERHDFLSEQSTDLSQTIKSLESIIKELDLTIKEQFDKEFKHISQKFEEYFKILFSGGNAKIVKVMADQMAEEAEGTEQDNQLRKLKYLQKHNATGLAGIEIQATPPGKKIKAIAMLSGGERALVAIALICAIISANPSPFVVLDEVDAALDEANSERLAKILDDLSHKTQFIIITHNRASMRRAAVLYGITMTIEGVSKLLSVKLEDIKLQ